MAISLADAVTLVRNVVTPVERVDGVGVDDVRGRVLAVDVCSPHSIPAFDNSAMDGFAVHAEDTAMASTDHPVALRLAGESRAGHPHAGAVPPGAAVRVSTGAVMPAGADAVVRVEDTDGGGGGSAVEVRRAVTPGHDVRRAGDDIRESDIVLRSGTLVRSGERAMLAAVGAREVPVRARPRVAVVSTGSELVSRVEDLAPGRIMESNSAMLAALAAANGAEVVHIVTGIEDTRAATVAALSAALAECDVLLISGGVSMGAHDHVRPALAELGVREHFWQVALRPGHPTWFGTGPGDAAVPVFGLPGNPVSTYVTFQLFAAPAIAIRAGGSGDALTLTARYEGPTIAKRTGAVMAVRVSLRSEDGQLVATPTSPHQRSDAHSSLVKVDGLALVPEDRPEMRDADTVAVRLIRS